MTGPARVLLTAREAAAYLGVSKSYFEKEIRPLLSAIVDLKSPTAKVPMPRWELAVIDQFIAARRTEQKSA